MGSIEGLAVSCTTRWHIWFESLSSQRRIQQIIVGWKAGLSPDVYDPVVLSNLLSTWQHLSKAMLIFCWHKLDNQMVASFCWLLNAWEFFIAKTGSISPRFDTNPPQKYWTVFSNQCTGFVDGKLENRMVTYTILEWWSKEQKTSSPKMGSISLLKQQEGVAQNTLKKSYSKCFRRTQLRWVIWRLPTHSLSLSLSLSLPLSLSLSVSHQTISPPPPPPHNPGTIPQIVHV